MHFTHTTTGYARVIVRLDERSLLQVVIDDVDRKSAVRVADVLVDVATNGCAEATVRTLERLVALKINLTINYKFKHNKNKKLIPYSSKLLL